MLYLIPIMRTMKKITTNNHIEQVKKHPPRATNYWHWTRSGGLCDKSSKLGAFLHILYSIHIRVGHSSTLGLEWISEYIRIIFVDTNEYPNIFVQMFLYKWISEFIRLKKSDRNECPNKYLCKKLFKYICISKNNIN